MDTLTGKFPNFDGYTSAWDGESVNHIESTSKYCAFYWDPIIDNTDTENFVFCFRFNPDDVSLEEFKKDVNDIVKEI